jgi:hypothetical protein
MGVVFHVPHVRMLGVYNGALASGACVCLVSREKKVQLRLIYVMG